MCFRVLKRSFLRVPKRSFLRVPKRTPDPLAEASTDEQGSVVGTILDIASPLVGRNDSSAFMLETPTTEDRLFEKKGPDKPGHLTWESV